MLQRGAGGGGGVPRGALRGRARRLPPAAVARAPRRRAHVARAQRVRRARRAAAGARRRARAAPELRARARRAAHRLPLPEVRSFPIRVRCVFVCDEYDGYVFTTVELELHLDLFLFNLTFNTYDFPEII